MWDTKFTTKNLTYYKNSEESSREVLYETHSCQIYKSNASISLVTLNLKAMMTENVKRI